jgi:excisionase family DNA binding protein
MPARNDFAAPETVTLQEAAAYLRLSVTTVRRLLADNQLHGYRLSRAKLLVYRASLYQYADQQRSTPPFDEGLQEKLRHARKARRSR